MKKAPNPKEYFLTLAQALKKDHPTEYKELLAFRLMPWDGRNLSYQREFGERLAAKLGNPYNYAKGTLVTNTRIAALVIERRERTEKTWNSTSK